MTPKNYIHSGFGHTVAKVIAVFSSFFLALPAWGQTATPSPNSPEARFYSKLASTPRVKTKEVGGPGGTPFESFRAEGGVLVGLEVWCGWYANHIVVRGIRPIFQTLTGRVNGNLYGTAGENPVKLEAKPGYAVAQVNISGGDRLDGLDLQFWKIAAGSAGLDAAGAYKSEWVGGKGGSKARSPLTGNGNPIVGICGAAGDGFDRLGLLITKTR